MYAVFARPSAVTPAQKAAWPSSSRAITLSFSTGATRSSFALMLFARSFKAALVEVERSDEGSLESGDPEATSYAADAEDRAGGVGEIEGAANCPFAGFEGLISEIG